MVEDYNTDDTFLARWIDGRLSNSERIAFEKTKEYKQFKIINEEAQALTAPKVDREKALIQIKQRLFKKSNKTKVIRLWQYVAVASVVILCFGLFFNTSKTYNTGIGEHKVIVLNDGSTVNLNANSSLSYKRFFWSNNKQVHLVGEAYFKVTKGDGFSVKTSKGIVSVLGTEFNVKDRKTFELKCYEGKVSFTEKQNLKNVYILTKGTQIVQKRNVSTKSAFDDTLNDWKTGFVYFKNQPLIEVLEELKYYYPITFNSNSIDTERLFTGRFNTKNLEAALNTTLLPMGILYRISDSNTITLSNKK